MGSAGHVYSAMVAFTGSVTSSGRHLLAAADGDPPVRAPTKADPLADCITYQSCFFRRAVGPKHFLHGTKHRAPRPSCAMRLLLLQRSLHLLDPLDCGADYVCSVFMRCAAAHAASFAPTALLTGPCIHSNRLQTAIM